MANAKTELKQCDKMSEISWLAEEAAAALVEAKEPKSVGVVDDETLLPHQNGLQSRTMINKSPRGDASSIASMETRRRETYQNGIVARLLQMNRNIST